MKHARPDYQRLQDPWNVIPVDEPVFLIRGQDSSGPLLVRLWAMLNQHSGANPDILEAANRQADEMVEWQREHGSKLADMPRMEHHSHQVTEELGFGHRHPTEGVTSAAWEQHTHDPLIPENTDMVWYKTHATPVVTERCTPTRPCPTFNPEHVSMWGECFVQSYERMINLGPAFDADLPVSAVTASPARVVEQDGYVVVHQHRCQTGGFPARGRCEDCGAVVIDYVRATSATTATVDRKPLDLTPRRVTPVTTNEGDTP